MKSSNHELNEFIFATKLMQSIKNK